MGVRKKDCWIIKCDICHGELENGEGGTLCFFKRTEAEKNIPYGDWTKKNGKLVCPWCYEEI